MTTRTTSWRPIRPVRARQRAATQLPRAHALGKLAVTCATLPRSPQREISSSRRFVVRGPIVAITKITATIALAMNRKTPVVP
jgi:hypothetical protein